MQSRYILKILRYDTSPSNYVSRGRQRYIVT